MTYCFVPGCMTAYNDERKRRKAAGEPVLSLFKGPSNEKNLRKWQEAIPSPGRKFSGDDFVCELHFPEEAIIRTETCTRLDRQYVELRRSKHLKHNAIPTIFPECHPKTGQIAAMKHALSKTLLMGKETEKVIKRRRVLGKAKGVDVGTEDKTLSSNFDISNSTLQPRKDAAAQVTNAELIYSFLKTIRSVHHLKALTGLSSFKILDEICSRVSPVHQPQPECRYFSLHDRILLVFIKLKLSLKFSEISLLFNIPTVKCKETFNEYVRHIGTALRRCILWPYKNGENAKCILDCVYIQVQKQCTLKFMMCVSPDGLIGFVSKVWGLRSSDKEVFQDSGFIDNLQGNKDSIVVDGGFLIDKFCSDRCINIDRLVSAKERVVVERVSQKIRGFQIFNDAPLPWRLVCCADDMFTICCAVVNMDNPLFNEIGN